MEYGEGGLAAADHAAVEAHLAECAACRELAGALRELDAKLTREVRAPQLSAGFDLRLRQRIQHEAVLNEAERAERKRRLQAEYEAELDRLRRNSLGLARIWDVFGYIALAGASVGMVWKWTPPAFWQLAQGGIGLSIITIAFLAGGIAVAFWRPARNLFEAI